MSDRQTVFSHLERMARIFAPDFSHDAAELYADFLVDFPDDTLKQAVDLTMREWRKPGCMPLPGFIIDRISRVVLDKHREDAVIMTQTISKQASQKPEDWSARLEDTWAFIDSRRAAQDALDLQSQDPPDEVCEEAARIGQFSKLSIGTYPSWVRRRDARARHARGLPLPSERAMYERRIVGALRASDEPRRPRVAQALSEAAAPVPTWTAAEDFGVGSEQGREPGDEPE